ncbi:MULTISPECIES: NUDIX hydrolase N-terminal domain-containing protein [unclassified Lactobacillus]|uniref:NUDIX hydrolase n=1 Tax=unclassified Lactobacillus TaxID=2620435 RepID=UPI000EFB3864|nr:MULTISPECIES: NUDIX hydrolase N-terminal domain-containing protein [unclassified Lactobacillus]RMC24619.1 NUDIX domain-containing protein [Lactobacillus sp. ESL0247]RMC28891.1 NUDIX domain-containing protein [Lactobacillus sp. ESL0246]RMC32136.1 NUDIX domain-containing protein [Lactobacillus sp. ESL0245]
MEKRDQFTDWAIELQSIAQNGLEFGRDRFDLERYTRLREIATEMMTSKTGLPKKQIKFMFSSEDGYQTPKLATRAAVFKNNQILLVKETTDNLWSMPGGWCEPNLSVRDNCIKEVKEEAGRDITVNRVIAIKNSQTNIHGKNRIERAINVCNIIFLCHEIGGQFIPNTETSSCSYFSLDKLPPLSLKRNNQEEITMCFAALNEADWQTWFN